MRVSNLGPPNTHDLPQAATGAVHPDQPFREIESCIVVGAEVVRFTADLLGPLAIAMLEKRKLAGRHFLLGNRPSGVVSRKTELPD